MKNIIVIINVYDDCVGNSTLVLEDNEVAFETVKSYDDDDETSCKPYIKLKRYLGLPYDFNQNNDKTLDCDYLNEFKEIRKKVDKVIYCEDGCIKIFGHIRNDRYDQIKELLKK